MDALKFDDQRDFVTRQYASLVADGLNEASARARLAEVLGNTSLEFLDGRDDQGPMAHRDREDIAARLTATAGELGASAADTQAACIHSLAEARLFALDWWRPVRTFLLYVLFLLGLAVVIAIIYAVWVLPAFSSLDQAMSMRGGAASWIMAQDAIRLFAPLAVMAILLVVLAMLWFRMRLRMERLDALAGHSRFPWLYGRSGSAYQALRCLEFASALKAGGADDAKAIEVALDVAQWPSGMPFEVAGSRLGEKLQQATRLGTFDAELQWQRRLHWSLAQAQLELSRDRLILFSRVLFYILIGIMVTVLYVPIFTTASMFGVH